MNALLEERIAFLQHRAPGDRVHVRAWPKARSRAMADQDLVRGILTNLLENAAQAAGEGGRVLGVAVALDGSVPSRCTIPVRA